jgi:hypothetical protein
VVVVMVGVGFGGLVVGWFLGVISVVRLSVGVKKEEHGVRAVYRWVIRLLGERQGLVSGCCSKHGVSEFWIRCESDKGA